MLLHGFPDDATMWEAIAGPVASAGYQVIAPDIVGYGASDMAPRRTDYGVFRVVADLVALLDHLRVGRAHLVGHDWGAALAWFFAIYHGQRALSLTAFSAGHPTAYAHAGFEQKRLGWYAGLFCLPGVAESALARGGRLRLVLTSHPRSSQVLAKMQSPGRLTAMLRLYRANFASMLLQRHPPVTVPTLGVWSTDDPALTERQMTDSERFVKAEWQYERLETGHWMTWDDPESCRDLILRHVGAVSPSS